MNVQTNKKGFTIIEVVLVLAIAALIFLMIFIALPALQRGQRDTGRKQDVNSVASAINAWRGNHRGKLPTVAEFNDAGASGTFRTDYIKTLGQYEASDVVAGAAYTVPATTKQMRVVLGRVCPSSGGGGAGAESSRGAAVYAKLEASNAIICTDA